jgi:putative dimethyl sulfoxide reductase chaperone
MSSNNITPQQLRLLAGLLAAPTENSLEVIAELTTEKHWLQEPLQELTTIPMDQWQAEYTRLFTNDKPVCPPFESLYRQGILNGPLYSEIERIYQTIGLETVEGIPSDYLGAMLECGAYLLEQKSALFSYTSIRQKTEGEKKWVHLDERSSQSVFQTLWQTHLAEWVPQFADDLQQHSEIDLYQKLGMKLKELF